MDGIAIVKDKSRGNCHRKRREIADCPAEKRSIEEDPVNAEQAHKYHRQPQRPKIATERHEREKKNIEVQRSVIIVRIVRVVPILSHLIAEPAVNSFIEMGWLNVQKREPKHRCEQQYQCRK